MRHDLRISDKAKQQRSVRQTPLYSTFNGMTPQQLEQWVEVEVKSLVDAKKVLTFLLQHAMLLSREEA